MTIEACDIRRRRRPPSIGYVLRNKKGEEVKRVRICDYHWERTNRDFSIKDNVPEEAGEKV